MDLCIKHLPAVIQLLLICTNIVPVCGQEIAGRQKEAEEIFTARVKQFNEFVDRFNFSSDFKGNTPDSLFRVKMPRDKMLITLFDLKDPRTLPKSKEYSEAYTSLKTDFINEVIKKRLFIDKYSPGVIAEAKARITISGNPQVISIFLNQEMTGNERVKWVILSVAGKFPEIFRTDTTMIRFIPPASNETDFINLRRALEDVDYLHYYAYTGFEPDKLTLFFYYLHSGILKYEYAQEVVYHIISIPGWYIRVKDFNRNELNSGWLISDVARNDLALKDFLKGLN